jgi:hypothetical protein
LIESPAWCALSLSGRRVLDRIEIDMCHQGGAHENGRLVVTHTDFIKHGVHRDAVAPAVREVEALGLAEITERGRGGNAAWRRPNKFRLTYIPTKSANADAYHDPTDEWRRIKTIDEVSAKRVMPETRRPPPHLGEPQIGVVIRNRKPPPKNGLFHPWKTGVETAKFRPRKTGIAPTPGKQGYYLYIR